MIIVRTSGETIGKVVQHAKHALNGRPRLSPGEFILIAQTKNSLPHRVKPIQYCMEFESCIYDRDRESQKIWGKFWPYLILGKNCRPLKNPFDICEVIKNSCKDYGRGGPIVYVDQADEKYLIQNGYLD
jgi:hypothetical protein